MATLSSYLHSSPLIGILRGITPHEVTGVACALYELGFRCLEVPLNSPQPFDSIAAMVKALPDDCLIGAGTVTTTEQVAQVARSGGRLIVMAHADANVIQAAKRADMICTPGVATPTEAFNALANGADALKVFPAEQVPPPILKAWLTVLPADTLCIPVGGITLDNMIDYWRIGARAFGLGSGLYRVGMSVDEVAENGRRYIAAAAALKS